MMNIDSQVTEHFRLSETLCPCCDRIKIVPGFFDHMKLLEAMRINLGFPININSGYRCPEHNAEVSKAKNSWHLLFATDVRPFWGTGFGHRLKAMYKFALSLDILFEETKDPKKHFGGIIYHKSFLHLDLRPEPYRARV